MYRVFAILGFATMVKEQKVLAANNGELSVTINQVVSQDNTAKVTTTVPFSPFILSIGNDSYTGQTDGQGVAIVSFGFRADGTKVRYPVGTQIDLLATDHGKYATISGIVLCRKATVYNFSEGSSLINGTADPNISLELVVEFAGGHYTLTTKTNSQGKYQFSLLRPLNEGEKIEIKTMYNGFVNSTGKLRVF